MEIVAMKCSDVLNGLLLDDEKQRELDVLFEMRKPERWDQEPATSQQTKRVIEKGKLAREKADEKIVKRKVAK